MMITKENYEIYFLDYLEGNLRVDLVDEFIEFLQQYPELKEELETFQMHQVPDASIEFPAKEALFKSRFDSDNEFDNAAIAMLENELPADGLENLLNHIAQNPERKKDLTILKNTFLNADERIVFGHKNNLYKSSPSKKIVLWASRVAAILVFLFTISSLFNENNIMEAPDALYAKGSDIIEKIEPQKKKQNEETKASEKTQPAKKHKPKAHKSLREESKGRLTKNEDLAEVIIQRDQFNPPLMVAKTAIIEIGSEELSTAYLSGIDELLNTKILNTPLPEEREVLLADKLKEKVGFKGFRFNQITKAGLDFASNISNNKVSYTTKKDGSISTFAVETRLLGFSIPNKKRN